LLAGWWNLLTDVRAGARIKSETAAKVALQHRQDGKIGKI
jgi:hypothetical protein